MHDIPTRTARPIITLIVNRTQMKTQSEKENVGRQLLPTKTYKPLPAVYDQLLHKIFSFLMLLNPWFVLQNQRKPTTANTLKINESCNEMLSIYYCYIVTSGINTRFVCKIGLQPCSNKDTQEVWSFIKRQLSHISWWTHHIQQNRNLAGKKNPYLFRA